MKLLYTLNKEQTDALKLAPGEDIMYCVPVDLDFDSRKMQAGQSYTEKVYLVVTGERFLVLEGESVAAAFPLDDCEKVKCEHQVHSGILTVTKKDGQAICAARFSMRHIVRAAYVARGAQTILTARRNGEKPEQVVSLEYEKYCEKCGRALPGTSKCPYCDGKKDMLKKFMELCGDYVGKLLLISLLMALISVMNLIIPMIQRDFIDGNCPAQCGLPAGRR